jgi:peptidoglycan/xylan/chitin deacetylase (PgdA/CDA1 family)
VPEELESLDQAARRRREERAARDAARKTRRRVAGATVLAAALGALALVLPNGSTEELEKGERATALERSKADRERAGAAVDEVLAYTPYLSEGTKRKPEVALTFDDGPSEYTDEILEELRKHDAPATFFVLGDAAERRPEVVRQALDDGHAIGAHSYDHPQLGQMTRDMQIPEIEAVNEILAGNDLPETRLFRPPYGSFNADTVSLLGERSELMVLWSVDSGDYENPGWQVIADRVVEAAEPGSVILLHDGGGDRAQTLVALPLILEGLRKAGLKPVTVPQLLADNPPDRDQTLDEAAGVQQPGEELPDGPEPAAPVGP